MCAGQLGIPRGSGQCKSTPPLLVVSMGAEEAGQQLGR